MGATQIRVHQAMKCTACASEQSEFAYASLDRDNSFAGYSYFKCLNCGSHFLDPIPDQAQLEELYRSHQFQTASGPRASQLPPRFLEPKRFAADRRLYVEPILQHVQSGRALDFACGSGWLAHQLAVAGFDATGMDVDPDFVEPARTHFAADYRVGGFTDLQAMATDSLDVLTASAVLEHLSSPEAFVAEAKRLLKPGGVLLIAIPTADSLQFEFMGQHFYWAMAPFHVTLFTTRGIKDLMARQNLELLSHTGTGHWMWTKAMADKLGIVDPYMRWRQDPDFVRFDIAVDELLDKISAAFGRWTTSVYAFRQND
jgi:SAM-dependent methyltransferase